MSNTKFSLPSGDSSFIAGKLGISLKPCKKVLLVHMSNELGSKFGLLKVGFQLCEVLEGHVGGGTFLCDAKASEHNLANLVECKNHET